MIKRNQVVIHYKQDVVLKSLRDVHIYYTSKKYNYAIMYVNSNKADSLVKYLKSNTLVDDIILSEESYEF